MQLWGQQSILEKQQYEFADCNIMLPEPFLPCSHHWLIALDTILLQQLCQISVLVHLNHDVAAPNKLAFDVDLRHCRPITELFDAFTEITIFEHVISGVVSHPLCFEDTHHRVAETALRCGRDSLHV